MKIQTILSAAVLTAILSTAASAQTVLDSIDNYVNDVSAEAAANFTSFSANLQDINGSVNIASVGSAGGSVSDIRNNIVDEDHSVIIGELSAGGTSEATSVFGGGATAAAIGVTAGGILNCDVGDTTGDDTAENSCNIAASGINLVDTLSTDMTVTDITVNGGLTLQSFGDVASTAIGAMSDATQNITETGATAMSSAAANTSNTASEAEFAAATGSGVSSLTFAINDGDINGSTVVNLSGGSIDFASIKATAVGSLNTSDVTAIFVGSGLNGF